MFYNLIGHAIMIDAHGTGRLPSPMAHSRNIKYSIDGKSCQVRYLINECLPPRTILQIPSNRLLQSVLKRYFRLPTERCPDLGIVDRIAKIMSFSVRNICDQTLRLFELTAYHFHDVDVLYIIERPINLRCSSSKDNAIR